MIEPREEEKRHVQTMIPNQVDPNSPATQPYNQAPKAVNPFAGIDAFGTQPAPMQQPVQQLTVDPVSPMPNYGAPIQTMEGTPMAPSTPVLGYGNTPVLNTMQPAQNFAAPVTPPSQFGNGGMHQAPMNQAPMNQAPMNQSLGSTAQSICPLIIAWATGQSLPLEQKQQIIRWEETHLADIWCSTAQLPNEIEARAALLQKVVRAIESSPDTSSAQAPSAQTLNHNKADLSPPVAMPLPGLWSDWIALLWTLWLPLAQQLDRKQRATGRPFIQGILGGQGTGKTTLSKMLQLILAQLGHVTVPLSIDDLYLTYAERQTLMESDERLIWRGPPGTHDIGLGVKTLEAIRSAGASDTVKVPQFDKSLHGGQGDRTEPAVQPAPTIVLFEGWFVGAKPIPADRFERMDDLPHPIMTPADQQFARDCNERLDTYMPLWAFLDSLMVLCPRDYRLSQQWRQDAEHAMKATGKTGLSDAEITDFVTYFWKALHPELFITPLTHSKETDLVVYIESDHSVGDLQSPTFGHPETTDSV
ncbi:MAG: hypothetical protein AB8B99_18465 [Phormidesmis sp.]